MLVKDLMSWPVITVFENTTVGESLDIQGRHNIRHLPVVDMNQALIGIVSETDLVKVFPNSSKLSTFESNLLSRTPVSKIMRTHVVSVTPDEILEKAALIMRTHHISCMPVMENKKLIGLLSKNDIIDAFIKSLGLGAGGTRITVIYRKKWGFLSEVIGFADKCSIKIDNMVTFEKELVLKVSGDASCFVDSLKNAGYTVTDVSVIEPPKVSPEQVG